ncbi:hypothetical protein GCM10028895_48910 [Pontibacter rugosus]
MKVKAIFTGSLIGICSLVGVHMISFLGFPYPLSLLFINFVAISPVSILIYKLSSKYNLSVDLALLTGISANIAWIILFILEAALIKGLTIFAVVGISFFTFLFGFAFTAIASNLFAKIEVNNSK